MIWDWWVPGPTLLPHSFNTTWNVAYSAQGTILTNIFCGRLRTVTHTHTNKHSHEMLMYTSTSTIVPKCTLQSGHKHMYIWEHLIASGSPHALPAGQNSDLHWGPFCPPHYTGLNPNKEQAGHDASGFSGGRAARKASSCATGTNIALFKLLSSEPTLMAMRLPVSSEKHPPPESPMLEAVSPRMKPWESDLVVDIEPWLME